MALKWRAPGAALGQKLDLEIGRAHFTLTMRIQA
jgi:hypothetical protein